MIFWDLKKKFFLQYCFICLPSDSTVSEDAGGGWGVDNFCVCFILMFHFFYVIQHCFICRPSDSTMSEDAGIETKTCQPDTLTTRLHLIHNFYRSCDRHGSKCWYGCRPCTDVSLMEEGWPGTASIPDPGKQLQLIYNYRKIHLIQTIVLSFVHFSFTSSLPFHSPISLCRPFYNACTMYTVQAYLCISCLLMREF